MFRVYVPEVSMPHWAICAAPAAKLATIQLWAVDFCDDELDELRF